MSFEPNTTPTPNWLYNGEMKKMNETELKVVLLVTRKTLGWFDPLSNGRKQQDYISQSQFIQFTGQSNRAIATAIQSCIEHGWIIARDGNGRLCDSPEKRARRKVWYQLGTIFTDKISGEESSLDESGEHISESGEHFSPDLVNNVHSTKETITKETKQNSSEASSARFDPLGAEIIEAFIAIDPKNRNYYGNKTQRTACDFLIAEYGLEKVLKRISVLPKTNKALYFPTITTPCQLRDKWVQLEDAVARKREEVKSKTNIAFV